MLSRSLFLCLVAGLLSSAGPFARFSSAAESLLDVRSFGALGDGRTLDSEAINRAIEAASSVGGGTVVFPAGEYLSHSIRLRSHVGLYLEHGARLVAAEPPSRPGEPGYDAAEPNAWVEYQDFGHSHWHNSLIWGEDLTDVSISGPGQIYGKGLSRGNGIMSLPVTAPPPPGRTGLLPDVLEADGYVNYQPRPDLVAGPFGYPSARDTLPNGTANKAIALKNCRNVVLRDFSILHGGHFGILATGVDNLLISGLTIDTNRDGMDVDSCKNVRITDCAVNSPWDDGICLKASHGLGEARATENVTISGCFVSGYDEGTLLDGTRTRKISRRGGPIGRIKLGTETGGGFRNIAISNCVFEYCRGLALEQVDGGVLEDVVVSNLTMRDIVNAPLFIRLGARLRRPETTAPGVVRRILVHNINASNVASDHGIFIAGLPDHPVEEVVLSDIMIRFAGGGTAEQSVRAVPEMEKGYPEPYLFGVLPSWGLFARHVSNLALRGLDLRAVSADARPAAWLEDFSGGRFSDLVLANPSAGSAWAMKAVSGLRARDVQGLPDGLQFEAKELERR